MPVADCDAEHQHISMHLTSPFGFHRLSGYGREQKAQININARQPSHTEEANTW